MSSSALAQCGSSACLSIAYDAGPETDGSSDAPKDVVKDTQDEPQVCLTMPPPDSGRDGSGNDGSSDGSSSG